LLLDHGADCLNSSLSFITYAQIVGGENLHFYIGIVAMKVLSHVIFLEEYFTGTLDFPVINFVNEGITAMFLNLLVGVFNGNKFFHQEAFQGVRLIDLLFTITAITAIVQFIWSNRVITKRSNLGTCIYHNLLIFYLAGVHFLVNFNSNNWLVSTYPKVQLYFFMFVSSRIIISLMVAHVMDIPYIQFQRYPMMLITSQLAIFIFEKVFLIRKTPENQMLVGVAYIILCLVSFVYLLMYLYSVIMKVSSILKVDILTIKPKIKESNTKVRREL
jgi:hypothetical protein